MAASPLKKDDLIAYGSAAAGHEGILSDPTGALVIKPCHAAEITFYEDSFASHQDFAAYIPTYMGKLSLSSPEQQEALQDQDPTSISAALQSDLTSINSQPQPDKDKSTESASGNEPNQDATAGQSEGTGQGLRKFGKKLESEMAIVLENVAAGFVRPCVLDVKLGERLWDDDAPMAKRARLDKVASETTSSSLGFRLAGMRIWQGQDVKAPAQPQADFDGAAPTKATSEETTGEVEVEMKNGFAVYNKLYGRHATDLTVVDGFKSFFTQSPAGSHPEYADMVLRCCQRDLTSVQEIMEAQESRMYSASILIVYEGDRAAMDKAVAASLSSDGDAAAEGNNNINDDNDDDDDDANSEPRVYALKLIDFAHAAWTPGQGPDENALRGIRNVRKILAEVIEKV